jgi:hypothetical protein
MTFSKTTLNIMPLGILMLYITVRKCFWVKCTGAVTFSKMTLNTMAFCIITLNTVIIKV